MRKTVGVIGAGVIGLGVAQLFAQYGYPTILVDVSESQLDKAKIKIRENIRYYRFLNKKKIKDNVDDIFRRICFTKDYNELRTCDFVIENVTEDWNIKKEVYTIIDSICDDECVFGANTSAISITKLASLTKRPDKLIGIHFMNPVPLISHSETIKGFHTSEETIIKTREYLEAIGKTMTLVNDFPGFVSNRISHLFMNEAVFTVHDGVAKPEEVDAIFRKCFGHRMGPLQTADLIGLDTVYNTLKVLFESYCDSKFRPCPLLAQMVDAGILGVKSGKGFYTYNIMS